jgi:hypothetical protein
LYNKIKKIYFSLKKDNLQKFSTFSAMQKIVPLSGKILSPLIMTLSIMVPKQAIYRKANQSNKIIDK